MRFAEAGCTFRGRILTGLDGILVGSDRRMEIKFVFRRGGVHVSGQDPDRIGRDPGGIRSTDARRNSRSSSDAGAVVVVTVIVEAVVMVVVSDRQMEVEFAIRRGRVHVSWQDPDGIGRDPGGIRSTDGRRNSRSSSDAGAVVVVTVTIVEAVVMVVVRFMGSSQ